MAHAREKHSIALKACAATVCPIWDLNSRAVEPRSSARREGFWMDDEAPPNGGLDAKGAVRRPRWGRRTPYGIRRDGPPRDDWPSPVHERQEATDAATYAALHLGTNNCRLLI